MRLVRTCTALTLSALALVGVAAQPASAGACASASATTASASTAQMTRATLCLVNQERSKRGLRALRMNKRLTLAARRHAADMVQRDYFSHDSPSGADFVDRIRRAGYGSPTLGEILAAGSGSYATPASTVRGWMNSAGHRANILNRRFREVGVGIAAGAPQMGGPGATTYALTFGG